MLVPTRSVGIFLSSRGALDLLEDLYIRLGWSITIFSVSLGLLWSYESTVERKQGFVQDCDERFVIIVHEAGS